MSPIISSGIRCPRCGRKEAVIELVPPVEEPVPPKKKSKTTSSEEKYARERRIAEQITVTHTFCGYQQTLRDYLSYHIIRGLRDTIDVAALLNRKLIVRSKEANTAAAISKAVSSTEGYLTDYLFILENDKITSPICPFCNGTKYSGLDNEIICECGHYQIPAFNMIYAAVQPPFNLIGENYPTQQPLKVSMERLDTNNKPYSYTVAKVEYYFNRLNNNQRLFIVSNPRTEGLKTDFPMFLKSLKTKLEPLFTVIEKI